MKQSVYHKLTDKIRFFLGPRQQELDEADAVIRLYLSEKANELGHSSGIGPLTPTGFQVLNEILGLTSSEVGEPIKESKSMGGEYHDGYSAGWNACLKFATKPKDSEVWCEHMNGKSTELHMKEHDGVYVDVWQAKFCPICGTPRPTPKVCGECQRPL